MILETFDQEKHDEAMKKDWYEAGREDERKNGIYRLISSLRDAGVQKSEIKNALKKAYGLSPDEAEKYME